MKDCPRCNTPKDSSEFRRNRTRYDGLHGECRACQSDRAVEYRARNRERIREQQRRARLRREGTV